jgi:hypothetical protein
VLFQVTGVTALRSQGFEVFDGCRLWPFSEHPAQVGVGFETVSFGGANERVQIGAGVRAGTGSAEQPVAPSNAERPDGVLDRIVVMARRPSS